MRSGTYRDVARPLRVTPSSTLSRPRMALVPPAHGGAALHVAAPPPVLVAPTIAHNFTRCALVGADNSLDYVYTPGGAKIVSAFPTLGWLDASSISPGAKAAPCLAIAAVTIPAAHGDWDGAVLQPLLALSELEAAFELNALSRFADALASLGILERAYLDRRAFLDAWEVALARVPSPSPFEILAGEIAVRSPFALAGTPAVPGRAAILAVAAVAPVVGIRAARGPPPVVAVRAVRGVAAVLPVPAVPAVAAVAASPGPPELQWWSYVTVGHSVDRVGPFPLLAFATRGLMAPDRCSPAARSDPTSYVRAVGDVLARHLTSSLGASAAPVAMARHFRRFQDRIASLPDALRSGSFDPEVLEVELGDDVSYGGDVASQDAVTVARLAFIGRDLPDLHAYLVHVGSGVAKHGSALSSLTAVLTSAEAKATLFHRLPPINAFLASRTAFLTQCWNKGLPAGGVDGVTSLLLKGHEEWSDSSKAPSGGTTLNDGDLIGSSKGTGLSEAALRRALVEDAAFVDSAEEILQLDLDTEEGRSEAVEIAALARCFIYQRFFAKPASLLNRHAVFAALFRCLGSFPRYFGGAQAADPVSGEIDPLQADWVYAAAEVDLFLRARFTKMALFNGPGAALALFNLSAAEPFVECPEEQLYIVESVLTKMVAFARATFTAGGWNSVSAAGYTMASLLERQLKHVLWIQSMGEMEQGTLFPHAQATFVAALQAAELYTQRFFLDPEPADIVLDHILPFGESYDNELKKKTAGAAPMVLVRRSFPGLLPPSTPRSLPGVTLTSPPREHVAPGGGRPLAAGWAGMSAGRPAAVRLAGALGKASSN